MPIYAYGLKEPKIHPNAFVHPDAVIIGDVTIGNLASIWPCAVLRADSNRIVIGERTSIQDGAVVHVTSDLPTLIGAGCTVGHNAHLEGCTMQDGSLVGSGALVLHNVVIEAGALVGAGAVVTHGTVVAKGALAVGVPAKILEGRANEQVIAYSVATYVRNAAEYPNIMRRLDV